MKFFTTLAVLLSFTSSWAQNSEDLVPRQAVTVFSVNDIGLLEGLTLDQLVCYDFMEEVQMEIFDGSTAGKTIKDIGINFKQKLNVFNGKDEKYHINGFTFGVEDKDKLFETFDDFTPVESDYPGVELYVSYFNRIAIKGENGILFRVAPNMELVDQITDSIWYSRGNNYPWNDRELQNLYEEFNELQDENVEFTDEMETDENTVNPTDGELPSASDDPAQKTYLELRDSVDIMLQYEFIHELCTSLFVNDETLIKSDPRFKEQLTHSAVGVFYSDNSRMLSDNNDFWYMRALYPGMLLKAQELAQQSAMFGDLVLEQNRVAFHLDLKYGQDLGSIYQKLSDATFDKNVLKYIHKNNSAYFSYNVNMREAYEQAYKVLSPLLEKSDDPKINSNLLLLELFDEFVNKDALFGTYKGSMFGTYNDVKKIKTKKIIFEYDEETFEYYEKEVEAEEDMPVFTLGFSTERTDIVERYLKRVSKISLQIKNEGEYWTYENAVLGAAPLYMIPRNGLFILTNDFDLIDKHIDGYGKDALSKAAVKEAKKSGAIYAYVDLGKAIEDLPQGLFTDRENEVIDVVRGKEGNMQITSSQTTTEKTTINFNYRYDESVDDSGTYILDLINSMYVIFK